MSTGITIRRIHTSSFTQDQAQRTAQDVAKAYNNGIFAGGVLLAAESGKPANSGLSFSSGVARTLAHGLNKKATGFIEVYGPDVPSAAFVGLRATAMPTGYTSATHIAVTPAATGTCFVFVF